MSKEEEDKELDLEAIEADNKYLTEVYASDAVRQYFLNRERQLIAEVKRLREELNVYKTACIAECGDLRSVIMSEEETKEYDKKRKLYDHLYRRTS